MGNIIGFYFQKWKSSRKKMIWAVSFYTHTLFCHLSTTTFFLYQGWILNVLLCKIWKSHSCNGLYFESLTKALFGSLTMCISHEWISTIKAELKTLFQKIWFLSGTKTITYILNNTQLLLLLQVNPTEYM